VTPAPVHKLVRNILLALLASLAKVEAQKISDRTRAGMARAKAGGKRIGRPRIDAQLRQRIAAMAANGDSPYAIGKHLGIDRHTAAKYAEVAVSDMDP
jgi:putative DNA-invertase from lambdoid prophage Rac